MGTRALACFLALAGTLSAAGAARAQTLSPGDRLVYETVLSLGFEQLPRPIRDPCTVETRLAISVGAVDPTGMDVDVSVSMGVRAVRYRGPSFCWAIEPVTSDGFIGRAIGEREAEELAAAVLPASMPALAKDLVRKELALAATVAALHDHHATARVSCGPEPFVRIDALQAPRLSHAQQIIAERYLRTALLLAFPPVPLDLPGTAEGYEAGGARYEVTGHRDAIWPLQGREHRVRALRASSAARAAFAFEALNDTGLEPAAASPKVQEWGDLHARLGIAGNRHVRVSSILAPRDGKDSVRAVASWHCDLARAERAVEVARR